MNIEIQRLLHKDHRGSIAQKDRAVLSPYLQKLEFEVQSGVESCVLFCLFYTIGLNLKPGPQRDFDMFIISRVKELVSLSSFYTRKTEDFACGAVPLLESHLRNDKRSSLDFCFSVQKRTWELWEEVSGHLPENPVIDLTSCDLSIKELVFFNRNFLTIESFQNQIDTEPAEVYLMPKNQVFCETVSWKKMNFFVSFGVAYLKQMMLMGSQQNGKTSFIKERVWNMLSKGDTSVLEIGVTRQTSILQVF